MNSFYCCLKAPPLPNPPPKKEKQGSKINKTQIIYKEANVIWDTNCDSQFRNNYLKCTFIIWQLKLSVANHRFVPSIYSLYIHICFRPHQPWTLLFSQMSSSLAFNFVYRRASETEDIYIPYTYAWRTSAAGPIALV